MNIYFYNNIKNLPYIMVEILPRVYFTYDKNIGEASITVEWLLWGTIVHWARGE